VVGLLLGSSDVGEERMFSERLRLWSIMSELGMLGYEMCWKDAVL
jgi:hypothetical protein